VLIEDVVGDALVIVVAVEGDMHVGGEGEGGIGRSCVGGRCLLCACCSGGGKKYQRKHGDEAGCEIGVVEAEKCSACGVGMSCVRFIDPPQFSKGSAFQVR